MSKVELVCTTSTSRQESEVAKNEINDCVVRAFASAFDIPYDLAHHFCAVTFKRKPKQGTFGSRPFLASVERVLGRKVVELGEEGYPGALTKGMFTYYRPSKQYWGTEPMVRRAMTVKTFLERYSQGTYLVYIDRHVFTIKDGVVYGNHQDARRLRARVRGAFQVTVA